MTTPNPASKRLAVAERRQRVADAVRRGRRLREIAADLGVDPSTISRDLKSLESSLRERAIRDIGADRSLQRERLDAAINAIWPQVLVGDAGAVRNLVRLVDRIARLDGLDAPRQVEATVSAGDMIRQWAIRDGHDPDDMVAGVTRLLDADGFDPR